MKEGNAVCNKCNWQVNISLVEIQGPSDKKVKRENLSVVFLQKGIETGMQMEQKRCFKN